MGWIKIGGKRYDAIVVGAGRVEITWEALGRVRGLAEPQGPVRARALYSARWGPDAPLGLRLQRTQPTCEWRHDRKPPDQLVPGEGMQDASPDVLAAVCAGLIEARDEQREREIRAGTRRAAAALHDAVKVAERRLVVAAQNGHDQDLVLLAEELREARTARLPVGPRRCDCCGAVVDGSYCTDDEVCAGGDGPGFYLCEPTRSKDGMACLRRYEGLPVEGRRELFTLGRSRWAAAGGAP